MKNIKILLIWLAVWSFIDPLAGQNLKFMTYNIRLDVASDGDDDWNHRRDFMVGQIKFYAPDVFGIQEGLPHQVDYLQEKLTAYQHEGIGREGVGKGEASSIFYDKRKFSVKQSHTFWLSPTPDSISMGWDAACLRVCTAILLKNKQTGQRFWVFNTHLDHMGQKARDNGIDLILKKIQAFNAEKLPIVFMGDLNSEPQSSVVVRLRKELLDTGEASEMPSFGPSGTFNGFKFNEPVTKLIDYIFISRNSGIAVRKHAVLSDSRNLHYPSDHLAVYVELGFGRRN